MINIKSILDFGSKIMKIKTMKSWISINDYSSREVSSNKSGSKRNKGIIKVKKI